MEDNTSKKVVLELKNITKSFGDNSGFKRF